MEDFSIVKVEDSTLMLPFPPPMSLHVITKDIESGMYQVKLDVPEKRQ
jgi:hypothetical protein